MFLEKQPTNPSLDPTSFHRSDEPNDIRYTFDVTLFEVYNDIIRDLLDRDAKEQSNCDVRQGPDGVPYVSGLKKVAVMSTMDVMRVWRLGSKVRATGRTNMNEHSSRSHLLLAVHITAIPTDPSVPGTKSKLTLVDLAGSERLNRSGSQGDRLVEAQHINKSLHMLGTCMSRLVRIVHRTLSDI